MEQKPTTPSPQVQLLAEALKKRGLHPEVEYWDGHKHVDIALIQAKMFIEVDGIQHLIDPEQIIRDVKRDHFSDGDDYGTIHIPNLVISHYLENFADAITEVAQRRMKK